MCLELGMNKGLCLYLNLLDNQSIEDCINETIKVFGGIDVLINNAGVLAWKPLLRQSISEIEAQIRVNLEGPIKMTRLALPYLREMIINVASGAGKYAFAELTTYCATKFGLRGFTQALAKELPHLKVYSVNPGMTATRMTNFQGGPPSRVARTIADVAEGRSGLPSGSDIDL
ncbi:MAG: SDR family oxidoreductase [Nitrospirae bacterium]|nr:MAG: SDR family oxidoreductase [Nitrospirota bacterium]